MCIIVAKNAGTAMPSASTMRNCFANNPDGAGFMVATGKTVVIRKGFMDYGAFEEALGEFGDLTDRSVVLHFRIATHGGVKPGCCHPFPVTSDEDALRRPENSDYLCMAHNGVISGMDTDEDTSDTMAFIRDIVAPLRRTVPSLIYNDDVLGVLEKVAGSKLAFLDPSGELVTLGKFIEHDGVLYSNSTYASYYTQTRSYERVFAGLPEPEMPSELCQMCPDCEGCMEFAPYCTTEGECAETLAAEFGYTDVGAFYADFLGEQCESDEFEYEYAE